MATEIKDQVVQETKSSAFGLFSIRPDESTDVPSCSQLMVFARYANSDSLKVEFLFRSPLELTTKASDMFETFSSFFYQKIVCGLISVIAVQMEHQLC